MDGTRYDWGQVCLDLLGISPSAGMLIGSQLSLVWLGEHFTELPPDANEFVIQCYTSTYVLQLIDGCLFGDKSKNFWQYENFV